MTSVVAEIRDLAAAPSGQAVPPAHRIRSPRDGPSSGSGVGRHVGIEIKAASAPGPRDAQHLLWLREQLGERFVRGIVFHTGPQPFELGERIWALPICAL
jgi:hypothetical protein